MRALRREQAKKDEGSVTSWEGWLAWLRERQEAIDNAKTPEEKAAVATKYKRSYIGQI
jgi:hypothetical protein